jgi:hypothetical protein
LQIFGAEFSLKMLRGIAGVVGGLVAWFLIATVGNLVLRATWPSYAEVEVAMTFTLGMLLARLFLGAFSSLGAGLVVAWITNRNELTSKFLAGVLFVMFIPIHYTLWKRFPPWYHLVFLASLILVTLLGASLYPRRTSRYDQEVGSGA